MKPVSQTQYRAAVGGVVPEPERIDERLWSVAVPMPGGSLRYTLSVVHVGIAGAVTVIDPGWDSDEGKQAFESFLGSIGREPGDVTGIVVTHAHPDHVGLAAWLRLAGGARLMLHEREQASIDAGGYAPWVGLAETLRRWGVPDDAAQALVERTSGPWAGGAGLRAEVLLRDGQRLPVDDVSWTVLHTPGHTPGHICIVDEGRRILFSGDHVLPTQFPGVGLGGEVGGDPIVDYLGALRRLEPYDDWEVIPGHGFRFEGLGERRREAIEHTLRRIREVGAEVGRRPAATVWEIAASLTWTLGWEELSRSSQLYPALRQVAMYRHFVLAGGLDVAPDPAPRRFTRPVEPPSVE